METKNIYQKLLEAQKEIGAIKKDSDNPYFKSKYVDINGILAVVKPILNKHGLVLLQALNAHIDGSMMVLRTSLTDVENKEEIVSVCPLPAFSKPQETGSAITYFRRYALQSLLALESEDDDGNVASGNKPKALDIPKGTGLSPKHVDEFMRDLEPTQEEVTSWKLKMENAKDLKSLQAVWKSVPPMVQDRLEQYKNERKFQLS